MFVRAKHFHWQNTDLQVNTTIIHLPITVAREREREKEDEERKSEKKRFRVSRG
jgi:hypothetical protein